MEEEEQMTNYILVRKKMQQDRTCESDIEMAVEMAKGLHGDNETGFKALTAEKTMQQMKPDPEWELKHKEQIKQALKDREKHLKATEKPYKIPLLWIRDKASGRTHLYGTDSHDSLHIDDSGGLHYYNLQNGDGTGKGGSYEFVDHDTDGMMYDQILHYYCENE